MNKRTDANRAADKRYREKMKGAARLPGFVLPEATAAKLDALAKVYGTKKAAIIAAVDSAFESAQKSEPALLSEQALAKDWEREEESEAWDQ